MPTIHLKAMDKKTFIALTTRIYHGDFEISDLWAFWDCWKTNNLHFYNYSTGMINGVDLGNEGTRCRHTLKYIICSRFEDTPSELLEDITDYTIKTKQPICDIADEILRHRNCTKEIALKYAGLDHANEFVKELVEAKLRA